VKRVFTDSKAANQANTLRMLPTVAVAAPDEEAAETTVLPCVPDADAFLFAWVLAGAFCFAAATASMRPLTSAILADKSRIAAWPSGVLAEEQLTQSDNCF
jgi:hypothetical protein